MRRFIGLLHKHSHRSSYHAAHCQPSMCNGHVVLRPFIHAVLSCRLAGRSSPRPGASVPTTAPSGPTSASSTRTTRTCGRTTGCSSARPTGPSSTTRSSWTFRTSVSLCHVPLISSLAKFVCLRSPGRRETSNPLLPALQCSPILRSTSTGRC